MLCPLDVISLLVTLQGDCESDIRVESLRLLIIEDERHPSFLDNRLIDGIEAIFNFQLRIIGRLLVTVEAMNTYEKQRDNAVISQLEGAISGEFGFVAHLCKPFIKQLFYISINLLQQLYSPFEFIFSL